MCVVHALVKAYLCHVKRAGVQTYSVTSGGRSLFLKRLSAGRGRTDGLFPPRLGKVGLADVAR